MYPDPMVLVYETTLLITVCHLFIYPYNAPKCRLHTRYIKYQVSIFIFVWGGGRPRGYGIWDSFYNYAIRGYDNHIRYKNAENAEKRVAPLQISRKTSLSLVWSSRYVSGRKSPSFILTRSPFKTALTLLYSLRLLNRPSLLVSRLQLGIRFTSCSPSLQRGKERNQDLMMSNLLFQIFYFFL